MTQAQPFTVAIPEERLADMRRRLAATHWAPDFGNADWRFGVERRWLQDMVAYWLDGFDWRAQEAEINRLPNFKVVIDDVPIHFIHVRSGRPDAMPIILTHGWPWTFWDWQRVIEPLAHPERFGGKAEDAFDVVVPSLPGYGFSEPLRTTGIDARAIASLWAKLMRDVLGYPRFAAAGGDWGGYVSSELGHCYPEFVTGVYLTVPLPLGVSRATITPEDFAADEQWMLKRVSYGQSVITSHVAVHVHDPQTLAYALADSPVGTAAWLWERRRAWSDCAGDVVGLYGRDFLCATASLYWLTDTIGTSLRLYPSQFTRPWQPANDSKPLVSVPTALAVSPKEIVMTPRAIMAERVNLQRYTIFDRGGHFAPSEYPEQVIDEFRAFFRTLR